ncbi:alpha/beta hydrolase family protein [Oceanobacillus halotolerans]|uniref:alpha/beta hydrolase family protein n=1 Tax=Oceanobacillus halotolerans TaxID=2663380 RepID=UPI0013DC85EB|nr:alpha/beta hydrolase [Oceanobacillus halotolerans]
MKKFLPLVWFTIIVLVLGCNQNQDNQSLNEQLTGQWTGMIQIPEQPLFFIVEFEQGDEFSGNISIPVQGVESYPLSSIKVEDSTVLFLMEVQGQFISFEGTVDGKSLEGTFKQHGQSYPFQLTKGSYKEEESDDEGTFLTVETNEGELYGELETPDTERPHPIAIIIPGSGPTDRNGNAVNGRNDSLKMLAESLSEQGVASLRYDKRGAGKNESAIIQEEELQFEQFVEDAKHWVNMLESEDYTEIGIIGHSQGSLVGMLAAEEPSVDFFISLAGAGRPIDEVLYDQLSEQLSEDLLEESVEIMDQLKKGNEVEQVSTALQSVFRPSVQGFTSSWMQYDPVMEIGKLTIPTLIVNGENDIQVPVTEAEMLHEAKEDAKLLVIPQMNHVLKEAPADRQENLQTYADPSLPLAEGLIEGIMSFLKESQVTE